MSLAKRHVIFVGYCLVLLLLNSRTIVELRELGIRDATASHLIFVPLVSIVLLFQRRDVVFESARWAPWAGGGVMAIAAAFYASSGQPAAPVFLQSLTATVASLVMLCYGGFALFYGPAAFRAGLFPLSFLAFSIPLPQPVLDAIVHILKVGSTEIVSLLFTITGTSFFREDFVFALPGVTIEVANECSGIRSGIALFLTSLLAGYRFLEQPWTRTLLVLLAIPVTVLKNGIRIVGLSLMSIHVDPGFLAGRLHHEGGMVFFVLALALMCPVLLVVRRLDRTPASLRDGGSKIA